MAFLFRRFRANGDDDADSSSDSSEEDNEQEEAALLGDPSDSTDQSDHEEAHRMEETHPKGKYDTTLPARHLYLGELDEETAAQRVVHHDNDTPTLLLLCLPDNMIFPGEILPMHIYDHILMQILRQTCANNHPVAICSDCRQSNDSDEPLRRPKKEDLFPLGTTADIVGYKEEGDFQASRFGGGQAFIVMFQGRQRFHLLECKRKVNGLMEAIVRVLPELLLPAKPLHLFAGSERVMASANQSLAFLRSCETELEKVPPERLRCMQRHLDLARAAMPICQVSRWCFDQVDFHRLRERIKKEQQFKAFAEQENAATLPNDVTSLSYWLVKRLATNTSTKLELLSINCPTRRILRALDILQVSTQLLAAEHFALTLFEQ